MQIMQHSVQSIAAIVENKNNKTKENRAMKQGIANWTRKSGLVAAVFGVVSLAALNAGAGVIVYEGFDTGGTDGVPIAGMAGATSTGFAAGSTWSSGGNGSQLYQASGLSWNYVGGLSTTGGAVLHTTSGAPTNPYQAHTGRMLESTPSGTLYGSFLIQANNSTAGIKVAAVQYVDSTPFNTGRVQEFAAAPVAYSATAGTTLDDTPVTTNDGLAIAIGSPFLTVFKVTGVGETDTTATITMWIMSQAQYDSIVNGAGAIGEQTLNSLALGTGTDQLYQRFSQTLGNADMSFENYNATLLRLYSNNDAFVFDEVRLATSLFEVSGIPEPSSLALLGLCGLLALKRRRNVR